MSPAAFGRAISDAAAKVLDFKAKSTLRQLIENQLSVPCGSDAPPPPSSRPLDHPAGPTRGGIRATFPDGGLCDPMQRNHPTRQRGAGA